MKKLHFLLLLCLATCVSFAQSYRPKAGETVVTLSIEKKGKVQILFFTKEAPKATAHILNLISKKFYEGQRFHRVERSPKPFLVQIGDPDSSKADWESAASGNGGTGERIPYENSGYKNDAGMVGLAHLPEDKDSGDSQFYVLLGNARFLDGSYTVFGKVVSGLDLLSRIERGDRVESITVERG